MSGVYPPRQVMRVTSSEQGNRLSSDRRSPPTARAKSAAGMPGSSSTWQVTPTDEKPANMRAAFAAHASGVAVVTALTPLGAFAITTNRVVSLSIEPPLIGWTMPRRSRRSEAFTQAQHFAVHLLGHDQQALALHFARQGRIEDVQGAELNAQNVAVLPGCLGVFECRLNAVQRFGDHDMIVGEVMSMDVSTGEALLFHHDRYGKTCGPAVGQSQL